MFSAGNIDFVAFAQNKDAVRRLLQSKGFDTKEYKWRFQTATRYTTFAALGQTFLDPTDKSFSAWGLETQSPSWKSGALFLGRVRVSDALVTNFAAAGEALLKVHGIVNFYGAGKHIETLDIFHFPIDGLGLYGNVYEFFCCASHLYFETTGNFDIRPNWHLEGIVITPQQ